MSKAKKILKALITFIPWLIYLIRLFFQIMDELSQAGTYQILKALKLTDEQNEKIPTI